MSATPIRLSAADMEGSWSREIEAASINALHMAEQRLGITLDASPYVQSIAPEAEFYRVIGMRPHNVMAVAIAAQNRIVINRQEFLGTTSGARLSVLVHEFSHLIVGRRVAGGVPRWMDEGLAMITAREHSQNYYSRLAVAAAFGHLKPLNQLWPALSGEEEELAYAESLSATRFFLKETWGSPDNPAPLLNKLADVAEGDDLRALLRDPRYIQTFELRWRSSMQTFWSWISALTGGGIYWVVITALFMLAYWRKSRMTRQVERDWQEEEDFPYNEEEVDLPIEEEDEEEDFRFYND